MAQAPRGQQQQQNVSLGFPPEFKVLALEKPQGMNTKDARSSIDDNEVSWQENFLRLGTSDLRTLYDMGPGIFTAPIFASDAVLSFFPFNIGSTQYLCVFTTGGRAVQVRVSDGAKTTISGTANTFWSAGLNKPAAAQWGSQFLLIVSRKTTNSYWIWDGTKLCAAGSLSPLIAVTNAGIAYTSAPTVTIFGGSGSGATATATVTNGAVTAVTLTNAGSGYVNGDAVAVAFSGGGNDTVARAHCTVTAGVITAVVIDNAGSGYAPTPTVTISGGGGTGATAIVSGIDSTGKITGIFVTAGGTGYAGTAFTGSVYITPANGAQFSGIIDPVGNTVKSVVVNNGGFGFISPPLVAAVGGGGTGAILAATISAGGIVSAITIINGGSSYTSAPTLVFSGGNGAAVATVDLMPFGVSGDAIETFLNRVWVTRDDTFTFSAPGSTGNFSTSGGGGTARSTDNFLKVSYPAIKQANGFLYPFGDSSINVISNVQTTGSPSTTTFNNANTDPQVGTPWRDSIQAFGRALVFANPTGIFGLFGGTAEKLSEKLDETFFTSTFTVSGSDMPSSAVAMLFEIRCYLFLLTVIDPFTGSNRRLMIGWDGKGFFVASQSTTMTFIATLETNANPDAYGTDGTNIYKLFSSPSNALTKILQSKLWSGSGWIIWKQALRWYQQAVNKSPSDDVITQIEIDTESSSSLLTFTEPSPFIWLNNSGQPFTWINNTSGVFGIGAVPVSIGGTDALGVTGRQLGYTMRTTSNDFILVGSAIGYKEQTAFY